MITNLPIGPPAPDCWWLRVRQFCCSDGNKVSNLLFSNYPSMRKLHLFNICSTRGMCFGIGNDRWKIMTAWGSWKSTTEHFHESEVSKPLYLKHPVMLLKMLTVFNNSRNIGLYIRKKTSQKSTDILYSQTCLNLTESWIMQLLIRLQSAIAVPSTVHNPPPSMP